MQALWEMPELSPDTVLLRRGNPGKGQSRKTVVRSVRLPAALCQAMRTALLGWMRRAG